MVVHCPSQIQEAQLLREYDVQLISRTLFMGHCSAGGGHGSGSGGGIAATENCCHNAQSSTVHLHG